MPIRIKAILVIVLTALVIVSFSIFAGIFSVRGNIEQAQETDLLVISDIADHFVSGEIELLKQKASETAYRLSVSERAAWPEVLAEMETRCPEFIGAAVFAAGQECLAVSGEFPAPPEVLDDKYIQRAFQGKAAITSTTPSGDGLVFYAAAPLPGTADEIVALTLPGTYFSDLVDPFTIWETGHIFMDDAEGRLISNIRPTWVADRADFVHRAGIDPANEQMVHDIRLGLVDEAKIVRYSIFEVPRLCAYRPISGSEEGWLMGVVAPLTESPFRYTDRGLVVVGVVSMLLGLVVAVIASDFIAREHDKMIEEMRRAEIAEERDEAKNRFLATMSHEIRTPMNSIMGFAELAMDTPDDIVPPKIKDYFSKILDNTRWLLHIVNDILDISKIESGKMELDSVPFDPRDVFERCESIILPAVAEKGLAFRTRAAALPAGKMLVGDPIRLAQALMNLLSNAVKFSGAGTVELSSRVSSAADGKTAVYFEVKDSGIGISREQLEKIFAPFVQADSNTTRKFGGVGLGLAITKNILDLMGGALSVESTPGVGSAFSFEIVFDTIDAPAAGQSAALKRPRFDGLVLVCDDNLMNQEVIRGHLSRVGLETIVAENGQIGVNAVRERARKGETPFDLILMDILMPVMDGMEAALKIRELDAKTPIVAMTANIMASDLENYKKHGMPDCVGKPFTSQELWRVLLKHLTPLEQTGGEADRAARPPEAKQGGADEEDFDEETREMLRLSFARNNQTKFAEITDALASEDWTLAHRLAHSLKGNAGMIGEHTLRRAAAEVEALLKSGKTAVPEELTRLLKEELARILDELRPLLDQSKEAVKPLSAEETRALLEKLEHMIENVNPACIDFLDTLRAVPGGAALAEQLENFDFESAAGTLAELKTELKKEWA